MPRPKLAGTATVTTVVETTVKLSTKAREMLLSRAEEADRIRAFVREHVGTKKKPGRSYRIRDEVYSLFIKEKQGKALIKGVVVDGYKYKLKTGSRSVFDKDGFMREHGLTQADFDAFTEKVDNESYVEIRRVGDDDDE
jgi:hypothetical protein